jgi:hypothetical protein
MAAPHDNRMFEPSFQASKASTRFLAKHYGLNPKTMAKWRRRPSTSDAPMGHEEATSSPGTQAAVNNGPGEKIFVGLQGIGSCERFAAATDSREFRAPNVHLVGERGPLTPA